MSRTVVHMSWEGQVTFTLDDDDVVRCDGEKLGEQGGDFTPFLVGGYVLVVGESPDERTRFVYVNENPVTVNQEATGRPWMAPLVPFVPEMTITVVGRTALDGEELWRIESPPLTDRPGPVFGPSWTRYSPAD